MASKPERVAERTWKAKCKKKWPGCEIIKQAMFMGYGTRGRGDEQFLGPYRSICFLEFKRRDKEPTELQRENHRRMKRLGYKVHVVYTWQEAFKITRRAVKQ